MSPSLTPSPAVPAGAVGPVTLVEGSTFCASDGTGDIRPGGTDGLFYRDARIISRWELRLDGHTAGPLSARSMEAFGARFLLRRAPTPGRADSTVLVVRERLVGDGMRETVTLENLGWETTAVNLALYVDADFADLFAVKEGRVGHGGADATAAGTGELILTARSDGSRRLSVTATAEPLVLPGALNWRVVIPPRKRWTTEIIAAPELDGQRVQPQFPRGERPEISGPARNIEAWRNAATTISTGNAVLNHVLRRTEADLGALRVEDPVKGGGPFVAAGAPWYMTLFGRDSLLASWMALPLSPSLALGTLQTLAKMQGRRVDPLTEEEPGKILHELRSGPDSSRVLGGTHYYGTVDATPLFVMLLAECWRWGADEATIKEMMPAADAAVSWMGSYGDRDGDGFLEYQRATDRGLINQGWKDSSDGINDAAGQIPGGPLALCEVQGYAYAAYLARADLADCAGDVATADHCRARAADLRQRFAESFWLPDRGWYAVALDGRKRPVDALTSNIAHCLWTGIAPDEHAAVIIKRLTTAEMDNGYGLRTLATSMGAYNPMSYHNGSVWPHDTAIAVAGLLRYAHLEGAVELAHRLAAGLLDAAAAFGGRLPELFCGFSRDEFSPPVPYPTSCSPQAWASAAPLLLLRSFLGLDPDCPHRRLAVRPNLPASWGKVTLEGLRLGGLTVQLTATGREATVQGLPGGWAHPQ
jgi:glycogen debranching enzyme